MNEKPLFTIQGLTPNFQSIASGRKPFVEEVKKSLGFKAIGKYITGGKDHYQLKENVSNFGGDPLSEPETTKKSDAAATNTFIWRDVS